MKTFCPNCEKETECTFTAELYECDECGEDFARHIVGRTEDDFDKMPTEEVNRYLSLHGYKPEQVGIRGKILVDALVENMALRGLLERFMSDPGGCRFCDYGVLRNPAKTHDEDCIWLNARAYLDKKISTGAKRDLSDDKIEELRAKEAENRDFNNY